MTETIRSLVEAFRAADTALTAPGTPFEVVEEDVLGDRLPVFENRPRHLRQVLQLGAGHGDRDCYVFDDSSITFVELERQAASVAAALRDRYGVGPGDRVAICGANCAGWLVSFWAATSMGAVVVGMNGWWTTNEMAHALELTQPTVVLADAKRAARLPADLDVSVVDLDTEFEALRQHDLDATWPELPLDEDDPAMLIFTSGTTGRPKAAVQTHRSIVGFVMLQSLIGARAMHLYGIDPPAGPPPTRLAVFPLFHVSGMGTAVGGPLTGGATVWPLGRFDPAKVIRLTKEHGIAAWQGTVTHVMRLLEDPAIETIEPTSIVQVGIGGSASTPELIRRTEERFPHLRGTFSSGYGSTETGGLATYATNAMLRIAPECVGPPLPTVAVRIVDDLGDDVPDGEQGHIVVRSPIVMKEYWRHPEANAEVFLPGRWVRTGDFGRLQDGALFMASRTRDLIIRGGENVYPFEIENRLEEHPDIDESAVYGVDEPVLGQEVKAVVVVREGSSLTADDIRAWCAESLASYKVPSQVEIRTEGLPRNATGKILKHVLAGDAENTFVED